MYVFTPNFQVTSFSLQELQLSEELMEEECCNNKAIQNWDFYTLFAGV